MKKYIIDIKPTVPTSNITIESQDSYYGGGETYSYQGESLEVEITFNDKSKLVVQTTYISAWLNCIEGGYCKIKINDDILNTKGLIKL